MECIYSGSFLEQVLEGNVDSSEFKTEDFISKRNELYKNVYDIYNNQEGGKAVIEASMKSMLMEGVADADVKSAERTKLEVFSDNVKKHNKFLTKISSIVSLDVNTFNYYMYSYFNVDGKGNGSSDFMPLVQQEEAIYDQVAMIVGNSSDVFSEVYDTVEREIINEGQDKRESIRVGTFKNVIRLNAAAGTGKTKLVAGTTIKIVEQMMGGKTLATAANSTMAKDLHDELKNIVKANIVEEQLGVEDIVNKLEAGDIDFLDDVNTLLIDEASLIQADSYVAGAYDPSKLIFNKLHSLLAKHSPNTKIILLGDSKQLSYYIKDGKRTGVGYKVDGSYVNKNALTVEGIMESSELTDSFRTSSFLLQTAFNSLRNYTTPQGHIFDKVPLVTKFAIAKGGEKKLLGLRNTEGKTKTLENKTKEDYVSDFIVALNETTPGDNKFTVIDSIIEQVKNKEDKGKFDIIYAAGLNMDKSDFLLALENSKDPAALMFLKLINDTNSKLNFKYYGKDIVEAQGQEADYVFINFSESDMGPMSNNSKDVKDPVNIDYKHGMAIAYMLASRARLYVHTINNHPTMKFNSSFDGAVYNVLSIGDIEAKAKAARIAYTNVYEANPNAVYDKNGGTSVNNWGATKDKGDTPTEISINESIANFKNAVAEYNDSVRNGELDTSAIESIKDTAYSKLSDKDLDDAIKRTLVNIQNEGDPDTRRILAKTVWYMEQVLKLRNLLDSNTVGFVADDYQLILNNDSVKKDITSKTEKAIEYYQSELNKKPSEEKRASLINKIKKAKAVVVAEVMEHYGYSYAYPMLNTDRDGDRAKDNDIVKMESLGITNGTITSLEEKQKALGIKKSNENYSYEMHIKKEDGRYQVYVLSKTKNGTSLGKPSIILNTYSDKWEGDAAKAFFSSIDANFNENNTIHVIKDININDIISHITPGALQSDNKQTMPLGRWLDKNVKDNTLEFNGVKVKLGKKIYTYTGNNPKLKGKQFLVYTQSDSVSIDSDLFRTWAEEALDSNGDTGNFSGLMVDKSDVKHKVGMIMLNNKKVSVRDIFDKSLKTEFSDDNENNIFALMNSYGTAPNMVSFFAELYLALDSEALNNNKNLRSILESVQDDKRVKLFKSPSKQNDFVNAIGNLSDDQQASLVKLLDTLFNAKDKSEGLYGNYTGDIKDTSQGQYLDFKKGRVFTILEGKEQDGETFSSTLNIKFEQVLLAINTLGDNVMPDVLDGLLEKTSYFEDGIKTRFVSGSTISGNSLDAEYIKDDATDGVFDNQKQELEVNITGIAEPSVVLNIKGFAKIVGDSSVDSMKTFKGGPISVEEEFVNAGKKKDTTVNLSPSSEPIIVESIVQRGVSVNESYFSIMEKNSKKKGFESELEEFNVLYDTLKSKPISAENVDSIIKLEGLVKLLTTKKPRTDEDLNAMRSNLAGVIDGSVEKLDKKFLTIKECI